MVRRVLLYLVAFLSLAAPASLAAQASNQTLQVAPLPRDGEVLVSFKLEEPLTDEIRAAIQSGLTVKFSYKVDLLRSSAAWFDRRIASATVTASVKYDTLTRQYHYARAVDGRMELADVTPREDVAWSVLTRDFARLSLFRGASLEPNAEYYVKVSANTSPKNSTFVWPWRGDDAVGFAKFTFIR
ncbi:MAG TPA: DUF4390 domain-containing protein [Vicinamibacterales bacterium]|jgi:hypothetical protein|nr:DUF4390 domain-containing protein [Vicinamibacterales bacterium]